MVKLGGFLGRNFWPLLKTDLLLIDNVLKLIAKIVLIPLGLTAVALAADAGIQNTRASFKLSSANDKVNIFKWRIEWHNQNIQGSWKVWFIDKRW